MLLLNRFNLSASSSSSSSSLCSIFVLIVYLQFIIMITLAHHPSKNDIYFQEYIKTIPESELDANRSIIFNGERIFVPKQIPKLSFKQRRALIEESLRLNITVMDEDIIERKLKDLKVHRRSLKNEWDKRTDPSRYTQQQQQQQRENEHRRRHKNQQLNRNKKSQKWRELRKLWKNVLVARAPQECPEKFDAATEAFNKKTYVFAGEQVFQIWLENELPQRAAYLITDMFPNGPRQVKAALTNRKSGVTILIDIYRRVFRYRWNRRFKRFFLAQNSPQQLPNTIDFLPTLAFHWKDGNMIIANREKFVAYDPFWNVINFAANLKDYFPNLGPNFVGVVHSDDSSHSFLWLNSNSALHVYDMKKYKVVQQYPVIMKNYVACLAPIITTTTTTKTTTPAILIHPEISRKNGRKNGKKFEKKL